MSKTKLFGMGVIGILFAVAGCKSRDFNNADVKDSWVKTESNNPDLFGIYGKLEYNFEVLKKMQKGAIGHQPWSDTYWPNAEGGITSRWRFEKESEAALRFGYKSPYSAADIEKMTPAQINMLSPAEKFDIVSGGYRAGWPLWRREASLTTSCPAGVGVATSQLPIRTLPGGMRSGDWEGKCHAWTPAALHFAEPGVVDVPATKATGEKFLVHFGSSDIKALLIVAYDMFLNQYPNYARVGNRCSRNYANLGAGSASPCFDTNAGAFFVLTTNMLQAFKPGFVIDVDPGTQVWNQPVWKYEHKIVEGSCPVEIKSPAPHRAKLAYVETALYWVGELVPTELPHGVNNRVEVTNYKYCLEIDQSNNIIGGAWAGNMRPDFIWMTGKPDFSKPFVDSRSGVRFDMSLLMDLYAKSNPH
jgi:hypothetical protein